MHSLASFFLIGILTLILVAIVALLLQNGFRRFLFQTPPENSVSDLLPFLRVDDDLKTLVLKDGTLVQVVELEGIDFSTLSEGDEQRYFTLRKNFLNELAQNPIMAARISFMSIKVPLRHMQEDTSAYPNDRLKEIHQRSIPSEDEVFKIRHLIVVSVASTHDKQESVLHESVSFLIDVLHVYKPHRLSQTNNSNELLMVWQQILLDYNSEIQPQLRDISARLSTANVTFETTTGRVRQYDGETEFYGHIFSVTSWGDMISGEFFRDILSLKSPIQIFQKIEPKSQASAEVILEQQKRLSLIRFNATILNEFNQAIEEVQSKEESLFYVSTHIYVFNAHQDTLKQVVSELKQIAATHGVRLGLDTRAVEYLWFARFPSYDISIRPLKMLTSQVVATQEFHAAPAGLLSCDWGEGALRTFKTGSGSKYALQLHITSRREELAHSLVIAPSNSGKTTLFQHLIGGALRFPNMRAFVFDRLRGTQIFTESMGGTYLDLSKQDVKLNPLQLDFNLANRRFLQRFLLQLSGFDDDNAHMECEQVLNVLEKTGLADRTLLTGYNFGCRASKSDFSNGLRKWAVDESYKHIFQGPQDTLNLEASKLIGFEMTEIQNDPKVAAAVLNYVLYRIRQLCSEGSPHMIFIDETAPMLRDEQFKHQIAEMLREHRKLRGAITVCFQNPGDMEATGLRETILNQCQTVFLFQNPQAKASDYAMFDLTESQWEFIKGISNVGRKVKRGVLAKKPTESVIIDVDLSNLGPYLKLYRSGNDAVALVNQLKATYGEDLWIQEYLSNG